MPRKSHFSADPGVGRGDPLTPDAQTKLEFGRHLQKLMKERHWSQADVARAAEEVSGQKFGRDSVSSYIRGTRFPTPKSITQLAAAFGIPENELFPNSPIFIANDEHPSLQIKEVAGHPGRVWITVNRTMSFALASKIMALITEADAQSASSE